MSAPATPQHLGGADAPSPQGRGAPSPERTVLIVDDEPKIRQTLSSYLRRKGFRTVVAADGIEALEAIQRAAPDAVLLDIVMPRMDGLELLQCLKTTPDYAGIPVVMLTVKSHPRDVERGVAFGAEFYLPKPVTFENLLNFLKLTFREG